jgi:hypothetical protein
MKKKRKLKQEDQMKVNKLILSLITLLFLLPQLALAKESKVLIEDIVMRTVDIEDGQKIMFKKHSGIYYLKKNIKTYDSIKTALGASQKAGSKIKLKADPVSLEISEIVPAK